MADTPDEWEFEAGEERDGPQEFWMEEPEQHLTDDDEIMLRQVHPQWYQGGDLASRLFLPGSRDEGRLSVDRSALTSAEDAHVNFVSNGGNSVAVCGVTVAEFGEEKLPVFPDPLPATATTRPNDAHALVDFRSTEQRALKTLGKRLQNKALKRGLLYRAPE